MSRGYAGAMAWCKDEIYLYLPLIYFKIKSPKLVKASRLAGSKLLIKAITKC